MPATPKIYHIVHIDRLSSIIADGYLWCDAEIVRRGVRGTTIGMNSIKERRLAKTLTSHPKLHVGACVPFYFCPRSVMLYMIYIGNHPELSYRGGQSSIIHLEADLRQTVAWANAQGRRWAFTRRMPVLTTLRTIQSSHNWTRLTGMQCRLGIGDSARSANKRSSSRVLVSVGTSIADRGTVAAI